MDWFILDGIIEALEKAITRYGEWLRIDQLEHQTGNFFLLNEWERAQIKKLDVGETTLGEAMEALRFREAVAE